ncbi:DUF4013 domain-containing protein [Herpetosiphon geysericola]|uniref:DUF4013 domain-containing protein n=1 Tax=Herpetosiphon geysericola TaxID=70996 RepID=A0A0N8GRJ4_9CHLR|nr:DUF4013 domain-containing protein [Herpetosiphon geysericola]KPL86666.1 hypothetical protein SE18_11775 [Herpetosiphon geysericola]
MAAEEQFQPLRALQTALRTVWSDRLWLPKVALGGLFGSTIIGVIWPQGLVIEHLDNSSRGYRLPLPAWRQFGDKAVMGLLATVMDFVYFVFPQLVAAVFLFCAIVPFIVGDNNTIATSLTFIILGTLFGVSFLGSFSPVSKLLFARDGAVEKALGRASLRRALGNNGRWVYLQARLVTLPIYLPALGAGWWFWQLTHIPAVAVWWLLAALWLLMSCLFWAWLVVAQVYFEADQIVADREIEQRLAERKRAIS